MWPSLLNLILTLLFTLQEHMYMEPHSVVVVPGECDELTVCAATQAPGMLQDTIARITNRKRNRIQVIVKRLGTCAFASSPRWRLLHTSGLCVVGWWLVEQSVLVQLNRVFYTWFSVHILIRVRFTGGGFGGKQDCVAQTTTPALLGAIKYVSLLLLTFLA